MLVISTQNWSILVKFAKKNPAKSAVVYWLFLGEVSPQNFPWNRPIFLRICPWKSFEIWLFFANLAKSADFSVNFDFSLAKIPQNWPIFSRILTFFPAKILRNRLLFPRICPWKSREILPFFSSKYQKPCKARHIHVKPVVLENTL